MEDRRKNSQLAYHVRTACPKKDQRSEILADRRIRPRFGLPRILFIDLRDLWERFIAPRLTI